MNARLMQLSLFIVPLSCLVLAAVLRPDDYALRLILMLGTASVIALERLVQRRTRGLLWFKHIPGPVRRLFVPMSVVLLPGLAYVVSGEGGGNVVIAGWITVVLSVMLSWKMSDDVLSYTTAANIVSAATIISLGLVIRDYDWIGRLSSLASVRTVANWSGLSALILMTVLSAQRKRTLKKGTVSRTLNLVGICLLIMFVVLTMSRGVLIAICTATCVSTLILVFRGGISWYGASLGIAVMASAFLLFWHGVGDLGWSDRFIDRVSEMSQGNGLGIRFDLWLSAMAQLTWTQWIFGAGPGEFQSLAIGGGYFAYAHSLYIDALSTAGFLGLSAILFVIGRQFVASIRASNPFILGLLVFTVVAHLTHGTIWSLSFWLPLAFVDAANNQKNVCQ